MANQRTSSAIDSLLCRIANEVRELSQEKNVLDREVEILKANIAERRDYIETTRTHIKKLEEDADVKHNTLKHNKTIKKGLNVTQSLLQQYERTVRAELESAKASYVNEKWVRQLLVQHIIFGVYFVYFPLFISDQSRAVFKEKITKCRKQFQDHQESFRQRFQAKDDTTSPIVVSQDDVPVKPKEGGGAYVNDSGVPRSFSEKGPDSDPHLQPTTEADMEMEGSPVKDSMVVITAYDKQRHLTGPENSENTEEMDAQSQAWESSSSGADETRGNEQHVRAKAHQGPDKMPREEEDDQEVKALRQLSVVPEEEEAAQAQMEEGGPAQEEEQAPQEHGAPLPQHCQQTQAQFFTAPGTPTFNFNFSPIRSPVAGPSGSKSPAFMFSLSSAPSTLGYSGFGFDGVSSHDEALSFVFSSSEKNQKTKSDGLDFLFNQPEQSDDFQFTFPSESSADNKENSSSDFPFSFNF
ncbi:uncharacterized protein [Syngnathus scovelli]|uniref:uncharacterized protein isoform X2 n=1 Tax=Syngnathus scovelli TaxID=161590 RepID=UPI00210F9CCE|nr:uncharacterized protein LOC125973286 isoform X2 [Syngnathus scovelli]